MRPRWSHIRPTSDINVQSDGGLNELNELNELNGLFNASRGLEVLKLIQPPNIILVRRTELHQLRHFVGMDDAKGFGVLREAGTSNIFEQS